MHSFPGFFLLWATLSEETGSCHSPPPSLLHSFVTYTMALLLPGARCYSTHSPLAKHLWLFPKSVMMEGVRRYDQVFGKQLLPVKVFLKLTSTIHRGIWPAQIEWLAARRRGFINLLS